MVDRNLRALKTGARRWQWYHAVMAILYSIRWSRGGDYRGTAGHCLSRHILLPVSECALHRQSSAQTSGAAMTMKAHTYYIIFGRPPMGEASPFPPWRRHWVAISCQCPNVRFTVSRLHNHKKTINFNLQPFSADLRSLHRKASRKPSQSNAR